MEISKLCTSATSQQHLAAHADVSKLQCRLECYLLIYSPSPPRFPTPFSPCPLHSPTFPLVPANSTVPVSIQSTWWYQVTKRIHHTDAHEAQLLSVQHIEKGEGNGDETGMSTLLCAGQEDLLVLTSTRC